MTSKHEKSWEIAYLRAALEVDAQKMPGRIAAARESVAGRLNDLKGSTNHHAERHQMEVALAALVRLEVEVTIWPAATTELKPKKATDAA